MDPQSKQNLFIFHYFPELFCSVHWEWTFEECRRETVPKRDLAPRNLMYMYIYVRRKCLSSYFTADWQWALIIFCLALHCFCTSEKKQRFKKATVHQSQTLLFQIWQGETSYRPACFKPIKLKTQAFSFASTVYVTSQFCRSEFTSRHATSFSWWSIQQKGIVTLSVHPNVVFLWVVRRCRYLWSDLTGRAVSACILTFTPMVIETLWCDRC